MKKLQTISASVAVAATLALLTFSAQAGSNSVPFVDDFEGVLDYTPLVDGLNGWYASDTSCVVRCNYAYSTNDGGTNAASIPIDVTLSNRFEDTTAITSVWMVMDVRPVLYDGQADPIVNTNATVMFFVSSNGYFVVRDGTNWSEVTSTTPGTAAVSNSASDWVRLHWHQNYVTKKWSLFANYNLITNEIGFINTDVTNFSGFDVYNGSVSSSFLDNVSVMATNPYDLGQNGGDWLPHLGVSTNELFYQMDQAVIATNSFQLWRTNGFYSLIYTNTAASNWVTVVQTHGTNVGAPETIDVICNVAGLGSSTNPYTAEVVVSAIETNHGYTAVNSPFTIHISAVVGLQPPSNVEATDGVFSDKIRVTWDPVTDCEYAVYRNTINSTAGATKIGETSDTVYDDHNVSSGIIYYYWLKCIRSGFTDSDFSEGDSGELGVQPPAGVTATDGTYTNWVRVSWTAASGVDRYEVARHFINDSMNATTVGITTGTTLDDTTAVEGALYYYWVRSIKDDVCSSHFSQPDSGYAGLEPPSDLTASRGTYTNKITLSWTVPESKPQGGATEFELWRATTSNSASASLLCETVKGEYTDTSIEANATYYYWLKGKNTNCVSAFSPAQAGWSSTRSTAYVYDGLTGNESITTNTKYSCNWGGFYHVSLDHYEVAIGSSSGAMDIVTWSTVSGSPYTWSGTMTPGNSYYALVRGVDANGSVVVSPIGSDGVTCVGATSTTGALSAVYRLYSYGQEKSTYEHLFTTNVTEMLYLSALDSWQYEGIAWYGFSSQVGESEPVKRLYCQTLRVHLYTMNITEYEVLDEFNPAWQGEGTQYYAHSTHMPGTLPVYRFYHAGYQIHHFTIDEEEKDAIIDSPSWGWTYEGVAFYTFPNENVSTARGDEERARVAVATVLSETAATDTQDNLTSDNDEDVSSTDTGSTDTSGGVLTDKTPSDLVELTGDYDGDGMEDVAYYKEASGTWHIYLSSKRDGDDTESDLALQWGGPGFLPLAGDYSGEGLTDLAVYDEENGFWFIRTVPGELIGWNILWGGPGLVPEAFDYDGDGITDLVIYDKETGLYYVQSVDGRILLWEE